MGETMNMKQWAEKFNIPYDRFRYRLKMGWSMYKALHQPSRYSKGV